MLDAAAQCCVWARGLGDCLISIADPARPDIAQGQPLPPKAEEEEIVPVTPVAAAPAPTKAKKTEKQNKK